MSLRGAAALVGSALADSYRRGGRLFRHGWPAAALVIVPEFAQHVVEIRAGMFDSLEAAYAFSNDPLRWRFGAVKLTGLVLAFLACARFWWTREHGGRWWSPAEIGWPRLLAGIGLMAAASLAVRALADLVSPSMLAAIDFSVDIAALPILFFLLSGLFADRRPTLPMLYRRAWPWVFLLLVLLLAAMGPAQLLHMAFHRLALGAAPALVWLLMILDSLLVGLLASLVGAALFVGYDRAMARLAPPAPERASPGG